MALVCSCYHNTSKWHPKTIITLNYFSLLLRHVEELFCYFRHRLSATQLVKRFVKITFLMDELSGKENELHSLHDVICTLRLKLVFLCVVSLFWKEDWMPTETQQI